MIRASGVGSRRHPWQGVAVPAVNRSRRPLGRLAVAAVTLLALTRCGACDCSFSPPPPPALAPKPGQAATVKAPVTGTWLAAAEDGKGQVVLVATGADGEVTFATKGPAGGARGWATEPVLQGATAGPLSLALAPKSGEAVVAVVVHPNPDLGAPPIGAPAGAEAAGPAPAGEGELVVARRRLPRLWRLRPVAVGALDPSVAVDAKGTVHLAFLQRAATGYVVVYARLGESGVSRSVVGQTGIPRPPRIALAGGRPEIAYVADGPQILLATAGAGDAFSGRPVPAGVFGEPAEPPSTMDLLARPGAQPVLAFLRPFAGGTLHLFGHPVDLPATAKAGANLLMVSVFDGSGPESKVVAVLPKGGPPPSLALTVGPAGLEVAAAAGGTAVLALRRPVGWTATVPAGGQATAAALAGTRPVFLLGDRMHLGAAPQASRVGPH